MTPVESDLEAIRNAATRFRAAIEATDFSGYDLNLSNFPKDCCHHAAALLRLYMFDQGFGFFDKAEGRRPDGREHVWLRRGGIVIDITADQFDEGEAKVIVTRHSAWQLGDSKPTDKAMLKRSRYCYTEEFPVYPLILSNVMGRQ
jgi:hypothetical protein